jgi:hypothetical protein
MHYWQVPRLGSFMAVPLVYKSCLNIESFDKAVEDFVKYKDEVSAQKEEMRVFELAQVTLTNEKLALNEIYVPEEREWPEILTPVVEHVLQKFVICVDSLGQDRTFTDDQ